MDRRVGWVGLIEELEELDELAAAVAILDQGVHLAGQQIDAGQQADRAVALVFMVACEGRMHAGFRGQIGGRRCDRLDTGLLVVGDDRHPVARLRLRQGRSLLQDFHLAINAQHFGHLFRKLRVAALQVVPHLVRFHLVLVEYLAHRTLRQVGEARVALRRSVLACMAGQKSRCPQFVRRSFAFRHASDVTHVLASTVIVGSLPGRGRSSSAAMGPSTTARSTQRWTV